jgi:ATP-binding cassette subfamily C protein CydD
MSGYFLDRLQGLATLKLFGQATQELANINKIADGFREKTMAVLRIAFFFHRPFWSFLARLRLPW